MFIEGKDEAAVFTFSSPIQEFDRYNSTINTVLQKLLLVIVTIQKEKDSLEIKYFAVALSALLIIGGLYFKFLYDVPDGEEKTNNLVSWFLVVMGIIGFMMAGILEI